MGRGDQRSRKGKQWRGTHGKTRLKNKTKRLQKKAAQAKKD